MPSLLETTVERLLPAKKRAREEREEQRRVAEAEAAARKEAERIASRRRALLAGDEALAEITLDGRVYYGRRISSFEDAAARNLSLVADALEKAGIEYFLVPGRSPLRHVVGVRLEDRKALLTSLRELYRSTALYALKTGKDLLPEDIALYADGALPTALKRRDTIRFGEILLGPGGQLLADLAYGCDVEFWREGVSLIEDGEEDLAPERRVALMYQAPPVVVADALVAPRPNAVSDVLPAAARIPAEREISGRSYPSYQDFLEPRIDTVGFPIDVVYTWVDGDDPALAAKREAYLNGSAAASRIHEREVGASRYVSRDELKYSLRSLEMYAPFVRNIYIVTDGQTPDWLDTKADGVRVVDHKEIFSDQDALPVFNSHAIETQLHHIDGLSEHYLYFNDDVFLGRPVTAGHFFHGNGIAKLPFSTHQLGVGDPHPDEPAPNSAGKNIRELLREAHGRFTVNKFKHVPHPQIRSVMHEIEQRYAEDVRRTSRSRFRATTDIAMGASFHHHHAYLTGRAVAGSFRLRYVDIGHADAAERLGELRNARKYDFFCLNDVNASAEEQERVDARLRDFLDSYFPFPSRWER
ncbi:stealth family protein [Streptomyces sp. GC420]|uniref:stealth family protein n=1 Tax=Streptomyces sp. GC420 TaxID=2697568 RepID=UPI0014151CF8|nr:stealth family protein [Streptomyces sp. GC420]NBM18086.1 sugar phosphotransferase [Streptomyces sp. GC420]